MSLFEVILYSLSSFLGGGVSAITGMGGGVFLFSMMTFTLPITTIVPVHGLVQLFSNLSLTWWPQFALFLDRRAERKGK